MAQVHAFRFNRCQWQLRGLQRGLILFQNQPLLAAELNLSVVSGSVQNLLTVLVVYRAVVACAALAWRSLNRIAVALVAAVGAVWVWHRFALGCFPDAHRSGWAVDCLISCELAMESFSKGYCCGASFF